MDAHTAFLVSMRKELTSDVGFSRDQPSESIHGAATSFGPLIDATCTHTHQLSDLPDNGTPNHYKMSTASVSSEEGVGAPSPGYSADSGEDLSTIGAAMERLGTLTQPPSPPMGESDVRVTHVSLMARYPSSQGDELHQIYGWPTNTDNLLPTACAAVNATRIQSAYRVSRARLERRRLRMERMLRLQASLRKQQQVCMVHVGF